MLQRIGLAVALLSILTGLCAQADSLDIEAIPDTLYEMPYTISKTEIAAWMRANKPDNTALLLSEVPLYKDRGSLYHNAYFYIGRPKLALPWRHGFEQPGGAFLASLYHGYYAAFYPVKRRFNKGYEVQVYPYEPALSYIHAGLGDYEHHYARVGIMKNSLFSVPDLYYQGDLLAQNGYWTDINSAETSSKHYLSGKIGAITVAGEYANWDKDVAMTELLPVYWRSSNFFITNKLKHLYATVQHSLAELSIIHATENASAAQFYQPLESKTTQLQIQHHQNLGFFEYFASYEHAIRKRNYDHAAMFGNDDYKDKLCFVWDSYPVVGLGFDLQWLDWKRGLLAADITVPIAGSYLGAYLNMQGGKNTSPLQVQDIYIRNNKLSVLQQQTKREQAAYIRYEWKGISTVLAGGTKHVIQRSDTDGFDLDKEQPFIRLAFDVKALHNNWELKAKPHWTWEKTVQNMCESPEFRFESVQNLYYHLPYNNSLLAGFSVYGHSGYYAANVYNPALIEASTVLDFWAGFTIDDYFDLHLGMKNAMSSTLYGASPVPLSLFAELRWYYLN